MHIVPNADQLAQADPAQEWSLGAAILRGLGSLFVGTSAKTAVSFAAETVVEAVSGLNSGAGKNPRIEVQVPHTPPITVRQEGWSGVCVGLLIGLVLVGTLLNVLLCLTKRTLKVVCYNVRSSLRLPRRESLRQSVGDMAAFI